MCACAERAANEEELAHDTSRLNLRHVCCTFILNAYLDRSREIAQSSRVACHVDDEARIRGVAVNAEFAAIFDRRASQIARRLSAMCYLLSPHLA